MKIYDHQFCGVHNKIQLYPKDLDVDIIYVNKAVESDSGFTILFQVLDYRLIKSDKTNFRFITDDVINSQQILSMGQILQVEILYLKVRKLSVLFIQILSNKGYSIYDGPVIGADFQVKNFGRSIKFSSFQCVILSHVYPVHDLKYKEIRSGLSSSITIKDNDLISTQLPILQCQYQYGQYCIIKVSFPI